MVGKVRNDGGMTRSYSGGKTIGDDGKWWEKFFDWSCWCALVALQMLTYLSLPLSELKPLLQWTLLDKHN
jgi:hypothetical protein